MKALFKLMIVGFILVVLAGCGHMGTITGATAGAALGGTGGAFAGGVIGAVVDNQAQGRIVQGYGGGLRTAPCQPFHAEELMSWATELENSHQKRSAQVSNSNGRVSCYSSEAAGSQSGAAVQRGNVYRPSGQPQTQYRQAPMDGVKYQAVDM